MTRKEKAQIEEKSGNVNLRVAGKGTQAIAYSCVRKSRGGRAVLAPVALADAKGKLWVVFDAEGHEISLAGEIYAAAGVESLTLNVSIADVVLDGDAEPTSDSPADGDDKIKLFLFLKEQGMTNAQIAKSMGA